uniref:Uncharacterized protein n=1 Tax=Anguilla anguilla TaxID=7936 RepID=A0A0E9XW31_ANGAN
MQHEICKGKITVYSLLYNLKKEEDDFQTSNLGGHRSGGGNRGRTGRVG